MNIYKKRILFAIRPTIILLSLCAIFINSQGQSPIDSTRIVRLMTFNIYHGETMKGDFDLDRIANVIKSVSPDLVALQEVDLKTNRVKKLDLATELAVRTGLVPLFGKAMSFDSGEYGEGVLSGFSFLYTKNHALPFQPGKEPRAALEVNVIINSGDTIRFIGTHLDHTSDETDRINQAKRLVELFSKDDRPSILAGDLNAKPESTTINLLLQEWSKSFSEDAPTFPSENPRVKIDYILFRPANRWRVLETKVIDEKIASDHSPVLVILELLPE